MPLVKGLAPASNCAGNHRPKLCGLRCCPPQVHYGLFSGSSMFDVSEAKDKCCG